MLQFSEKNLQQCAKNNANFISRQLLFPHRQTHVITDYLVTGFLPFCSTTSKEAVDSWQTVSASAATAQQPAFPLLLRRYAYFAVLL